jgi:hypothetical protein
MPRLTTYGENKDFIIITEGSYNKDGKLGMDISTPIQFISLKIDSKSARKLARHILAIDPNKNKL